MGQRGRARGARRPNPVPEPGSAAAALLGAVVTCIRIALVPRHPLPTFAGFDCRAQAAQALAPCPWHPPTPPAGRPVPRSVGAAQPCGPTRRHDAPPQPSQVRRWQPGYTLRCVVAWAACVHPTAAAPSIICSLPSLRSHFERRSGLLLPPARGGAAGQGQHSARGGAGAAWLPPGATATEAQAGHEPVGGEEQEEEDKAAEAAARRVSRAEAFQSCPATGNSAAGPCTPQQAASMPPI